MNFVGRYLEFKTINAIIKFYSLARKTHYDVLNLRHNCTDKEIKEAFIKLSKEYHPDKNKDAAAQGKFVQIVEAYNVLSKPGSRARYDNISMSPSSYVYKSSTPYNARRNQYSHSYNHNFYNSYYKYQYQSKTQSSQNAGKNYAYGKSGVSKVPNYMIILMCSGLALFGCIVQLLVVREMYITQRHQATARSKQLGEELEKVRNAAQGNGNEMQTRLLLEKIVTAANPTVATASLGQALASEKK